MQRTTASNSLSSCSRGIILADLGVGDELDAFGFHQLDAAQHDLLLVELHVGNAVHEQAADAIGAFENGDRVAGLVQLRGGAKSRGTGADDRDFLAGAHLRRLGHDPAFFPAVVDDGALDVLDRDRRRIDAEHAGAFARRGTDAAGELGKVVGLVQPIERFVPQAAIDQIVPFRNQVVDRAAGGHAADQRAGVAERNAAIHAARALLAEFLLLHVKMELVPVAECARSAERSSGSSRRYSMNPVGFPMYR